jgi:hypothetical protein
MNIIINSHIISTNKSTSSTSSSTESHAHLIPKIKPRPTNIIPTPLMLSYRPIPSNTLYYPLNSSFSSSLSDTSTNRTDSSSNEQITSNVDTPITITRKELYRIKSVVLSTYKFKKEYELHCCLFKQYGFNKIKQRKGRCDSNNKGNQCKGSVFSQLIRKYYKNEDDVNNDCNDCNNSVKCKKTKTSTRKFRSLLDRMVTTVDLY